MARGDGRDGDGERAADEPDMTMLNAEKKREDGLRAGGKATSAGRRTNEVTSQTGREKKKERRQSYRSGEVTKHSE